MIQAGISIGVESTGLGGAGPVLAVASIFQHGDPTLETFLRKQEYVSTPTQGGPTGEIWTWDGRVGYARKSTIKIRLRNDSGSTINWSARWGMEVDN